MIASPTSLAPEKSATAPSGGVISTTALSSSPPKPPTDDARNAVEQLAFYPFGEQISAWAAGAERMKFTGHERDGLKTPGTNDDLDYMHARYCSPGLGRFLSLDPVTARVGNPQSWNRYGNVQGNPVTFIDPDGRDLQVFYLATGKTYDLTRHSAIYFRDDQPGKAVDVVFSQGGLADGARTLASHLASYNPKEDPTVAFRLHISTSQARILFAKFRRDFALHEKSGNLIRNSLGHDWRTNNCAQSVCTKILSTLRFDPEIGAFVEAIETIDSVIPDPYGPIFYTNDAIFALRALGVIKDAGTEPSPVAGAPGNVIVYWALSASSKLRSDEKEALPDRLWPTRCVLPLVHLAPAQSSEGVHYRDSYETAHECTESRATGRYE